MNPVVFCSFQPCARKAGGDLVFEQNGEEKRFAICDRHYEYLMNKYKEIDRSMMSREYVFSDEVPLSILSHSPDRVII